MQTGDGIQLEICSFQIWLSSPFVQSYLRVVACVYARAQLLPKLCCLFPWIKILILNCQQYIITSVNVQLNLRMFSCCIFFIILFQSHSIGLRVVCTMIAWNFSIASMQHKYYYYFEQLLFMTNKKNERMKCFKPRALVCVVQSDAGAVCAVLSFQVDAIVQTYQHFFIWFTVINLYSLWSA